MKKELIEELFARLEQIKYEKDLIEYWSARDLKQILEYTKWDNFSEHEDNNMAVRATDRTWGEPEELEPDQDIRIVKKRISGDDKIFWMALRKRDSMKKEKRHPCLMLSFLQCKDRFQNRDVAFIGN